MPLHPAGTLFFTVLHSIEEIMGAMDGQIEGRVGP